MFCFHLWRWDLCDSWSLLLPCEKEAQVHSQASLDEWIHQKLLVLFMFILWLLHIDSVVWFFYDYNLLCCGVWRTAQQGSLTSSHPTRKAKCQRNSYYRMEFTKYVGRLFIFSPSLERQTLPLSRLSLGFCHVIPEISRQRQCQLVVNVTINKNNFRTYTQSHTNNSFLHLKLVSELSKQNLIALHCTHRHTFCQTYSWIHVWLYTHSTPWGLLLLLVPKATQSPVSSTFIRKFTA